MILSGKWVKLSSVALRVSPQTIGVYTFLQIRLGVCLSGICARSQSLRMDAQIEINEYNRGRLWCAVHTCAHIKLYYLNTTCCHAVCTHPNCRSDVFISNPGAQIQPQALAGPRRGVVPPEGCLLKAHFTTMMLFPDQTWAWKRRQEWARHQLAAPQL